MKRAFTAVGLVAAMACGLLFIASCAAQVPVDTGHRSEDSGHASVVSLRFVTNRMLKLSGGDKRYFDSERGPLTAGVCTAAFKENDWRGEVLRVDTGDVDTVFEGLGAGRMVVYIHGYSESFERSCRRAARLQDNLHLDDRLVLFSWPSGNYVTYGQDGRVLRESVGDLEQLLEQLAATVGADRIVLMAHSMGSRGLVEVLGRRDPDAERFSEAVFIAPDVRRDMFAGNVQMLQSKVDELTVYMSDNDLVLWLSTVVNVSGRLGTAGAVDINPEHARFIDITPTGVTFIGGHLYHLFNPAVIEDLQTLLDTADENADRAWRRTPGETSGVWQLEAS